MYDIDDCSKTFVRHTVLFTCVYLTNLVASPASASKLNWSPPTGCSNSTYRIKQKNGSTEKSACFMQTTYNIIKYLLIQIFHIVSQKCFSPIHHQLIQNITMFLWCNSSRKLLMYMGTSPATAPCFLNQVFAASMVWFQHNNCWTLQTVADLGPGMHKHLPYHQNLLIIIFRKC